MPCPELACSNVKIVAFISGMIASVLRGVCYAPRLGKLGDRIGPEKILITALIFSVLLLIPRLTSDAIAPDFTFFA